VDEVKRVRRKLYCWLRSPGEWCLGRYPPDVPIGPYHTFSSMEEVEQSISPRYEIIWCGDALATRERLLAMRL
jgi:hypothetical protein